MLYEGAMTGRKVAGIPRGQRSGHVRYEASGMERPILESGWVRNPDIRTGVPLLGLDEIKTSRNGPPSWPKIGTRLVVNALSEDPTHRRWCRRQAYTQAYRRILGENAHGSSHRAHMDLFRVMMTWVQLGRPKEWSPNRLVNQIRVTGGKMVLVDRLLLYMQLDLNDDKFLEACNKAPVLLLRAPS